MSDTKNEALTAEVDQLVRSLKTARERVEVRSLHVQDKLVYDYTNLVCGSVIELANIVKKRFTNLE